MFQLLNSVELSDKTMLAYGMGQEVVKAGKVYCILAVVDQVYSLQNFVTPSEVFNMTS